MKYSKFRIKRAYRKEIEYAINKFMTDYPVTDEIVKIMHCRKVSKDNEDSFATTKIILGEGIHYEVKLNPKVFSSANIRTKLQSVTGANYESISDIIYHEFGHCLQAFMLCSKWNLSIEDCTYDNFYKYKPLDNCKQSVDEYTDYFKPFIKQFGWNRDKVVMHLGSYAADDSFEMLPECFNNYYRLKEKEHLDTVEQETYAFVKEVIDDYKKYIPKTL